MTQLLHTGDTHLGYRQYHSPVRRKDFLSAFERVVADAIEAEVDAVVHAGDLFQDRQPALTDVMGALSVLRRLDNAGIPFYGVVGNHESKRDSQWLDLFERLGVATRLGAEPVLVGDVALYGLDFVPRSRREGLDYEFDPAPSAAHTALVSHGLFEPFDHGDWDTRRLLDESPVAFDALLLGDDHTPRTKRFEAFDTWLTYPGSTERASASERDNRGYNLVEFDDSLDIRRRGLDTRRFVYVDVELEPDAGTERVLERLRQYNLEDAVVIVTVTGDGERVTPAEVEADATERGALVARVNDRRDHDDEQRDTEVSFANPDRAVERRMRDLGLSPAARELDELVRTGRVADTNVTDSVEERARELAEDAESDLFEPADTDDEPAGGGSTEAAEPADGSVGDVSAEDVGSADGSVAGDTDDPDREPATEETDGEVVAGGESGRGADTGSDSPGRDTDDGQIQLGDYS